MRIQTRKLMKINWHIFKMMFTCAQLCAGSCECMRCVAAPRVVIFLDVRLLPFPVRHRNSLLRIPAE
jgi:hypothetical protein